MSVREESQRIFRDFGKKFRDCEIPKTTLPGSRTVVYVSDPDQSSKLVLLDCIDAQMQEGREEDTAGDRERASTPEQWGFPLVARETLRLETERLEFASSNEVLQGLQGWSKANIVDALLIAPSENVIGRAEPHTYTFI